MEIFLEKLKEKSCKANIVEKAEKMENMFKKLREIEKK